MRKYFCKSCQTLEVKGLNFHKILATLQPYHVLQLDRKAYDLCYITVLKKDAKNIVKVLKRQNFSIKMVERFGLDRFLGLCRARIGIVIGMIFVIPCLFFLSQFTFRIECVGLESITEEQILEVLRNHGIETYHINHQDTKEIETILTQSFPNISMVSCAKHGTSYVISIKEKLPDIEQSFDPIVAPYTMMLTTFQVHQGYSPYQVGDIVKKGDILVYPYYINENNEQVAIRPNMTIESIVYYVGQVEFREKEIQYERTGKTKCFSSYYFGKFLLIQDNIENPFEFFEKESYNEYIAQNLFLPIRVEKTIFYELAEKEIVHNFEEEKDGLINQARNLAYEQAPKDAKIESEDVVILQNGDVTYVRVNLQSIWKG